MSWHAVILRTVHAQTRFERQGQSVMLLLVLVPELGLAEAVTLTRL